MKLIGTPIGGGGMNNITLSFPFGDQVCLNLFKAVTLYCNIVVPWQYVGPPLTPIGLPPLRVFPNDFSPLGLVQLGVVQLGVAQIGGGPSIYCSTVSIVAAI